MEIGEMKGVKDLVVRRNCRDRWKKKVRKGGSRLVEGLSEMIFLRFSDSL